MSATHWVPGLNCVNERWEAAYNRFETPEQERAKFRKRLLALGAQDWPRTARVADLFCGSGNNLHVLADLGFTDLIGVDLSPALLARYDGPAQLFVGDCTDLKLPDACRDIVIVQGGMHHLPELPGDLDRCLAEIHRVLAPEGLAVFVEPWLTPFLRVAHACCHSRPLRRLYPRLDALAVMIEEELTTYENWLARPAEIRSLAHRYFTPEIDRTGGGKWMFRGRKRP